MHSAYEKHMQRRRTGYYMIRQFFELYAKLGKELGPSLYKCWEELSKKETDDWETTVLCFFEETYPLYPQEPLV